MKRVKILLPILLIIISLCACTIKNDVASTNDKNSIVSLDNGSQNSGDDLLNSFVSSKQYLNYTESKNGNSSYTELSYCITDLNADGKNELLLWATDIAPFGNTWLFALDNNAVTLVFEHYGFGEFRYSPNHKAIIVPPEFRPFIGASYYEFCTLVQNKLEITFVIGADPDDESPQQEQYYYKEANNKKKITSDEFLAYFDNTVSFEWTKIEN